MTADLQERVGVAGIGLMGAAVSRALLAAGCVTHVWNRTASRCLPLVALGAIGQAAIGSLLSEVDVLLLVVRDYSIAMSLLEGLDLNGKLVIAACSGPIGAAEMFAHQVEEAGGQYLDAAILTYPDLVGSAKGLIITAGDRPNHERAAPALGKLGVTRFAGTNLSTANALSIAYGAFVEVAVIGGMQAAALFERCGGEAAVLFDVARRSRDNIEGLLSRLPSVQARSQLPSLAAYADIAAHMDIVAVQLATARDLGISMTMLEAAKRQLDDFARSDYHASDLEQCFRLLAPSSKES